MAHPDASRLPSVKANLKLVRRIPTPSATLCAVGLSKPLTNGFRQLLRSAGAAISLEPGPCPTDRHGFQLDASHNSRVSGLVRAGVEMHPIQGLKGVLPGQSPALNTVIVGIPVSADASTHADTLALLEKSLPTPRSFLAVDQPGSDAALQMLPEAAIESTSGALAMDRLLRTPGEVALITASPAQAALYAAAGHVVAGTQQLAITLGVSDNAWSCVHHGTSEEDACGLALACTWALFWAGEHTAAARLHNALLCTLEEGLHTAGLKTVLPYSRTLENVEMLQAIRDRLGASPRRLPAADYTPTPAAHLRRVG